MPFTAGLRTAAVAMVNWLCNLYGNGLPLFTFFGEVPGLLSMKNLVDTVEWFSMKIGGVLSTRGSVRVDVMKKSSVCLCHVLPWSYLALPAWAFFVFVLFFISRSRHAKSEAKLREDT